jgi:hypothetical protein
MAIQEVIKYEGDNSMSGMHSRMRLVLKYNR